jgi:SAM-dependent methyltransferase
MTELEATREDLARYYDERYAGAYMDEHPPEEMRRVADVLREIETDVESVLDYGCGQGAWTPVLTGLFPQARLSGIDISETAIDKARARFPRASFQGFDGESAPFENECFDLVFSYHVLEHVGDLEATVADMLRLVRPGGYLFAACPCGNGGSFEERIVQRIREGRERTPDGRTRFFYEDPGHLRRLETADLEAVAARHEAPLVRAAFGNQLWGALEWIASSDRSLRNELLNAPRGATVSSKLLIGALWTGLAVVAPAMRLYRADLRRRFRRARTTTRRALVGAVVPVKVALYPVGALVAGLSRREWQTRRKDPRGSAQYLLFRKRRGVERSVA